MEIPLSLSVLQLKWSRIFLVFIQFVFMGRKEAGGAEATSAESVKLKPGIWSEGDSDWF